MHNSLTIEINTTIITVQARKCSVELEGLRRDYTLSASCVCHAYFVLGVQLLRCDDFHCYEDDYRTTGMCLGLSYS